MALFKRPIRPTTGYPTLKGEFSGAVVVYLAAARLVGFKNSNGANSGLGGNTLPTEQLKNGYAVADFQNSAIAATAGTMGINFSTSGMTVLAVGSYRDTAGVQPVENLVNRANASVAGGFNINLYNTFGGTPASVFASYNKTGPGDTNWDSVWVNSAKATSGNGNPGTAVNTRYAVAVTAAVGPAASTTKEVTIGREQGGSDSSTSVEMVIIWPRKLTEEQMRRITADPYSVFAPTSRLFVDVAASGSDTPINPGVGSIAITGYAPTLAQTANQALTPGAGSLALTGYAPTVARTANQGVSPGVGSLALTGYAPTVAQSANQAVLPGVGSIAITGYAPTIAQTANQAISPGVGSLVLTGYAPTISQPHGVAPGVGSLVITGFAPTISQPVAVSPGVGSLAITGYAPTISQPQALSPGAGAITLTGYAPTVAQTGGQSISPGVGSITITGYAPTIAQPHSVLPGAGALAISGYAPTLTQTANQGVAPGAGVLALTGYAPSVDQTANQVFSPGAGAIAITGYAPTVSIATPISADLAAIASAVWGYVMSNGKTAEQNVVEIREALDGLGLGIWGLPIEGTYTAADLLRVIAAVQAGKSTIDSSSPGTATVEFRAIDDSVTRVSADMVGSERADVEINAAD